MKRDCHDAVELLAQRLRASLSDTDEQRLRAHLDACEACRTAASDQRFVEALMAKWPETPADDTAEAVAAVRAGVATMPTARPAFPARLVAIAAAAAVLVAAALALPRLVLRSPAPDPPAIASQVPWETVQATATATSNAAMQDGEEGPSPPKAEPVVVQARKRLPRRHHTTSPPPEPTVASSQPAPEEELQPPSDLAEFFALGPPPEEPDGPEYEVQQETLTAPDGSSMTVTVFTDPQTGERVAHVVEVVVPANELDPGAPLDVPQSAAPDGPPVSGELPRGGRIG